jgi:hypothetical protein
MSFDNEKSAFAIVGFNSCKCSFLVVYGMDDDSEKH